MSVGRTASKKWTRWAIRPWEEAVLELALSQHGTAPSTTELSSIATICGQPVRRVRVWFQNRRQRRRDASETPQRSPRARRPDTPPPHEVALLGLVNVCAFFPAVGLDECFALAATALGDRRLAPALLRAAADSQAHVDALVEGKPVEEAARLLVERARSCEQYV